MPLRFEDQWLKPPLIPDRIPDTWINELHPPSKVFQLSFIFSKPVYICIFTMRHMKYFTEERHKTERMRNRERKIKRDSIYVNCWPQAFTGSAFNGSWSSWKQASPWSLSASREHTIQFANILLWTLTDDWQAGVQEIYVFVKVYSLNLFVTDLECLCMYNKISYILSFIECT